MRKSRFSEDQIIGILKEQQAGLPVAELCRKHGISDATFWDWNSPDLVDSFWIFVVSLGRAGAVLLLICVG